MINSVNLTSVSLGKNQLGGIRVVEGSGLVKVDISENNFQGLLPDLTASSGLQIFDASNNKSVPPPSEAQDFRADDQFVSPSLTGISIMGWY